MFPGNLKAGQQSQGTCCVTGSKARDNLVPPPPPQKNPILYYCLVLGLVKPKNQTLPEVLSRF